MTLGLINANPVVHAKKERVARTEDPPGDDAVDPLEIYDILLLFIFPCFYLILIYFCSFIEQKELASLFFSISLARNLNFIYISYFLWLLAFLYLFFVFSFLFYFW